MLHRSVISLTESTAVCGSAREVNKKVGEKQNVQYNVMKEVKG